MRDGTILVSILMTSYNREKYIEEAIVSVIKNSYTFFELIIVDDASSDKTVEIAKKYEQIDNRITVHVNESNLGQFKNRNKAALLAIGTYLLYVDSDDQITETAIEDCLKLMLKNPNVSFGIYCDNEFKINEKMVLSKSEAIKRHFLTKPFLMHGPGATIIKKSLFIEIGGFPIIYGVAGDLYYNLNASSHSSIILIPFQFLKYRIHEGQEINNTFNYLWANYKYLMDAIKELPLDLSEIEKKYIRNKNRRRFIINLFKHLIKTKDFKSTLKAIDYAEFKFFDLIKGVFH